jgi:hypothetical protein
MKRHTAAGAVAFMVRPFDRLRAHHEGNQEHRACFLKKAAPYFFTSGQSPWSSGRKASFGGIVASSL